MRALAALGLALLLAGCGAPSPQDELAARVDDATVAANARDAAGLREAAQALADAVSAQRDAGDLPEARAAELIALATQLRASADLVDPEVVARKEAEARAREEAARARAEEQARAAEAARQEQARQAERARQQQGSGKDDDDDGGGKGGGKGKGKDDD